MQLKEGVNKTMTAVVITLVVVVGLFMFLNSSLRYLIIPPKDLYMPLVLEPLDLLIKGKKYRYEYKNKYSGEHMVAIIVDNPPRIGEDYNVNKLSLKLEVKLNKQTLLLSSVESPLSLFWTHAGQYNGFAILRYSAPDDLPLDTPLSIVISAEGDNSDLLEKYSGIKILVSKTSDK